MFILSTTEMKKIMRSSSNTSPARSRNRTTPGKNTPEHPESSFARLAENQLSRSRSTFIGRMSGREHPDRPGFFPRRRFDETAAKSLPGLLLKKFLGKSSADLKKTRFQDYSIYQMYSERIKDADMRDASTRHISYGDIYGI